MKFIRIDTKGEWRGEKHISSISGLGKFADVEDVTWEKGVSCYSLENQAEGIENLRKYWFEYLGNRLSDLEGMQITIFEGELVKENGMAVLGADGEDLAVCTKTIAEIDAVEFMKKVYEAHDKLIMEEITEEDYEKFLNDIELIWIKVIKGCHNDEETTNLQ